MAISLDEMNAGLKSAASKPSSSASSSGSSSPAKPSSSGSASTFSLDDMQAGLPPVVQKSAVDSVAMEPLKGLAQYEAGLVKTVGLAMSAPAMLADWVRSKATGKETTAAQDAMFANMVDPWAEREAALAPGEGTARQALHSVGSVVGMITTAVLTGPEKALAPTLTKATVPMTPTVVKSGMELARETARGGAVGMQIPAVQMAVSTGQQVLEETGDKQKAVQAALSQYANAIEMGVAPVAAQGGLLTRVATGAAVGSVQGEAARLSQNVSMPERLRTPFTLSGVAVNAVFGAGFGAMVGKPPADAVAEFNRVNTKSPGAFDNLAATNPDAARAMADHVEPVDPNLAKYMKRTVDKWVKASDDELLKIGEEAAKVKSKAHEKNLAELEPDMKTLFKGKKETGKLEDLKLEEETPPPEEVDEVALLKEKALKKQLPSEQAKGTVVDLESFRKEKEHWDTLGEKLDRESRDDAQASLSDIQRAIELKKNLPDDLIGQLRLARNENVEKASFRLMEIATEIDKLNPPDRPLPKPGETPEQYQVRLNQEKLKGIFGEPKEGGVIGEEYNSLLYTKLEKMLESGKASYLDNVKDALSAIKAGRKVYGISEVDTEPVRIYTEQEAMTKDHFVSEENYKQRDERLAKDQEDNYETVRSLLDRKPILTLVEVGDSLSDGMKDLSEAINQPEPLEGPPSLKPIRINVEPRLGLNRSSLTHAWMNAHESLSSLYYVLRAGADLGTTPRFNTKLINNSHDFFDAAIPLLGDGPIKGIFEKLRYATDPVQMEFVHGPIKRVDGTISRVAGMYYPMGHSAGRKIQLRVDDAAVTSPTWVTESFVHEVIHSAVYDFMLANPDHPLTKEAKDIFAAARKLIPQVIAHINAVEGVTGFEGDTKYAWGKSQGGASYGLKDVHEFLAEVHGSEQFQRLMANAARFDTGGILSQFKEITFKITAQIAKILRLEPREAKFLHQAWDITNRLMEAQKEMVQVKSQEAVEALAGAEREELQKVATAFRVGAEKVPGVKVAEGKLREYWRQVLTTVAPEALGKQAKQAGAILAKHVAAEAQRTSMIYGKSGERRAFWDSRMDQAREFINKFEKGERFADPLLQKAAEGYRTWNKAMFDVEQKLGLEYEAVDNYMYHIFKDNDGVQKFFEKKYGIKWGDPKFVKDRVFDLYEEAVAAGFEPKYTNPEDIMLARQHASDVARARIEALQELERYGLARRVKKGEKLGPRVGNETIEGFASVPRRAPNGQHYWIHEQAAPILHNLYDTPSLWSAKGMGGDAFRGVMWLKNASVPFILGLSGFHALHVATIDNATWMVRATKELLSGEIGAAKWLSQMGQAAFYRDVVSNPKMGSRLLHLTQGRIPEGELTQSDRMSLQFMAEGGFIPEMSVQYRTGARQAFMSAARQHSVTAVWKLPFAVMDTIQSVMFEKWIPALKAASYMRDVQTALKTDPTLMQDDLRRQVTFRKLSKSVDNRYGEMAYNTLFWNRAVKDLGVASTLSLGWNLGFIREYGGSAVEAVQGVTQKGKAVSKGDYDRAMFVTFYTLQSLAYGGLMTYFLTGDEPKELLDYTHPKNGEKNPDGSDQRVSTMFYAREFVSIYKHMEHEGVLSGLGRLAMNKLSPALGLIGDWVTNTNYFGAEISDPNAPIYVRTAQKLMHTFTQLEPITVGTIREQYSENPLRTGAMAVMGFSPAPKYITETRTEAAIRSVFQKYYGTKQTPYERAEYSMDARKLKDLYKLQRSAEYKEQLDVMKERYELTSREVAQLRTTSKKPGDPLVKMFQRLTWQQQKRLLDEMTPEEREVYVPHSNREHLRRKYQPPKE